MTMLQKKSFNIRSNQFATSCIII